MWLDELITKLMCLRAELGRGKTFVCSENDKDGLYVIPHVDIYTVNAQDEANFNEQAPNELHPKEGDKVILL